MSKRSLIVAALGAAIVAGVLAFLRLTTNAEYWHTLPIAFAFGVLSGVSYWNGREDEKSEKTSAIGFLAGRDRKRAPKKAKIGFKIDD